MEQPEPSAITQTADISAAVSRQPPVIRNTSTNTSNSVPSLRFPRPLGNRQLTNWVSSSSPDIMRPNDFQYDGPLDDSIADLGYEFIGTDGESQPESTSSYDHQIPELSDDVHSLAETDTGTDADATDLVDTDSSDDDEEQARMNDTASATATAGGNLADDDDEADLETMADRSLEHPTELFTPDPVRISQLISALEQPLDRPTPFFTEQPTREDAYTKSDDRLKNKVSTKPSPWLSTVIARYPALQKFRYTQDGVFRESLLRVILAAVTLVLVTAAPLYFPYLKTSFGQNGVLHTVPVASVSSVAAPTTTANLVLTASLSSTLTSATPFNALQTTGSASSLAHLSDTNVRHKICSAEVFSRNEILLRVPQRFKSAWLGKQSVMISVSRGGDDISSKSTKVSAVNEGFLIELNPSEAHGVVDVSVATTRKPKINETFHVSFGRYMIVDALDAGKQLVKGFAQTVFDTVNGTTKWVEETCIPAFDLVSKQVTDQTTSVSDSVMHGLRDASKVAMDIPGRLTTLTTQTTQVVDQVKQSFSKDVVQQRVYQIETEALRQAQDARDDMSLVLLQAQLGSKLLWLKIQGKTDEYQRYLAAAGPYFERKKAESVDARQSRAERTKKEIRARRKQERREARRSFWGTSDGGS